MRSRSADDEDVPLHIIRKDEAPLVDGVTKVVAHTERGIVTDPDDPKAVTKVETTPSGKTHYYVKRCIRGPDASHLYSSQGPMRANGRSQYEFREVSESAYSSYMRFVSTGNILHLRHAERA